MTLGPVCRQIRASFRNIFAVVVKKKVSYLPQAMAFVFCHLTPYAVTKVIHTTDLQMKYTTAGINSKSSNAAHTAPMLLSASTLASEKVCTEWCSFTMLYL